MLISLLTPTRGRPESIKRLYSSAIDTSIRPEDVEFSFYIDEDDEASKQYLTHLKSHNNSIKITTGERIVLSQMWNEAYKKATGDIFMHCGDDIIFRTKGWDEKIREAFNGCQDKILFVHGDDGINSSRFGTHGFIHRRWVNILGYFVPPYFSCDYNDTWLNDVANIIGRRKYIDILTEHMHWSIPKYKPKPKERLILKSELDNTYLDRIKMGKKDNVSELYRDLQPERERDAEKLKSALGCCGNNELIRIKSFVETQMFSPNSKFTKIQYYKSV